MIDNEGVYAAKGIFPAKIKELEMKDALLLMLKRRKNDGQF